MSWLSIIRLIVIWYATIQLIALAALPLTLRVLRALPDRGYSLAKFSGMLLIGVVYWLAYSYGLLRNERGGVWVAFAIVAATSWIAGWGNVVAWWRTLRQDGRLRALLATEAIFALAFVGWAIVRAYDPSVNHTEQPMDLMFMNSIWSSPTFPPQDAWLAGYSISYYYLGYWLLATLGRLANTPPNLAYNLGQAAWYGYLWVGCFSIVLNLVAWRFSRPIGEPSRKGDEEKIPLISWLSIFGGFLGGLVVAFVGNLQIILEWLYAQGVNIDGLAKWANVHEFPERASQTGEWFISQEWWWWRSSRIIQDTDLLGRYHDVIDESPIFSYLLGDNHPHVMAMPIVLLIVALALNLFLLLITGDDRRTEGQRAGRLAWLPLDGLDIVLYLTVLGSLVFANTWDYPPYWLLLVAVVLLATGAWRWALAAGGALFLGTILLFLPYFLTAQSQASGIVPNVFNPTHLPQFLIIFGASLPALIGVILLGWRLATPNWPTFGWVALVVLGIPIAFLALATSLSSTAWGQAQMGSMELPEGVSSYGEAIMQRWLSEPWTLIFVGVLLAFVLTILVTILLQAKAQWAGAGDLVFVLLLAGIGLALVYAPEFVFLRDYFGTRMNTVFKFYYQGWLLLGLASAYLITMALSRLPKKVGIVEALAALSLLLILGCALFPFAGVYAKTGGFALSEPTLDATAYVMRSNPDVMAAVEWVKENTTPDERVLEAKGGSYNADQNRISAMTGRATLLGWDGHESQWRGKAYGTMAQGRPEAIEQVYRTASPEEIAGILDEWGIDYVYVGPVETDLYGITNFRLDEIGAAMDTVFSQGQVRIFRRRQG